MPVQVSAATDSDLIELAEVAALTFPLACPPSTATDDIDDIDDFIAATLSPQRFGEYLADPDRLVLIAVAADRIVGYTMLVRGAEIDPGVESSLEARPAVELSKMYVLPDWHRHGVGAALMRAGIAWAEADGARAVWLGVNQANHRAQRFYRKHGFGTVGVRTFRLGNAVENDFVMVRPRHGAAPD
jgi:ribosomal protein S18 acetylase RimI-like enzyme